jgi:hypothetical protein
VTDERTGMVKPLVKAELMRLMREQFDPNPRGWEGRDWNDNAEEVADKILALSAALAIPDAKPVAWAYEIDYEDLRGWQRHIWFEKPEPSPRVRNVRPLYASPVSSELEKEVKRLRAIEVEHEQWREAARCVVGADLPKYIRTLVAGWNGEDRPVGERFGRHPVTLGATIPTTCGAVYELDEAVRCLEALVSAEKVGSALNPQGQGEGK